MYLVNPAVRQWHGTEIFFFRHLVVLLGGLWGGGFEIGRGSKAWFSGVVDVVGGLVRLAKADDFVD